jgi:hypothetical protein
MLGTYRSPPASSSTSSSASASRSASAMSRSIKKPKASVSFPAAMGLSTGRFMSASVKMDEAYSFFRAGPACSLRPAQERIFGDVSARSPQVPDYALANVLKLSASPGPEFLIP